MRINPAAAIAAAGVFFASSHACAATGADGIIRANASAIHADRLKAWHGMHSCAAVSGDSAGTVCTIVDIDNGAYRSSFKSGPFAQVQGFDGGAWVQKNGVVSIVDLPGLHRDAVTFAYIQSDGWLRRDAVQQIDAGRRTTHGRAYDILDVVPRGGSRVMLWFDAATHLLKRAVISSEYGPDAFDYGDYRNVGGVEWAFSITEIDPTGGRTITRLKFLQPLYSLPPEAIARNVNNAEPALRSVVRLPMRSDAPTYMAHILLPVQVDGHSVQMLFDTGGQNSLDVAAAKRLGMKSAGTISVGGSGASNASAHIARVKNVSIGRAMLTDQQFIIFRLPYQIARPAYRVRVDGVVGSEILENFRVSIDYAARSFELSSFSSSPKGDGVTVPFWSDGSHAYVQAWIDGAPGLFGIDTGDPGGVTVFGPFARRHGLYRSKGLRYLGLGIGGTDAEDAYRGKSLRLGGVTLARPIVKVSRSTSGDFSARSVAGNLGADVLSRFTLTFDYHRRTVTFKSNSRARSAFRQDMTGLTVVQQTAATLRVLAVAPGTPAAKAGVQAGDEITAVDARTADEIGVKDFDRFRFGDAPFTLTIRRGTSSKRVKIYPRRLL